MFLDEDEEFLNELMKTFLNNESENQLKLEIKTGEKGIILKDFDVIQFYYKKKINVIQNSFYIITI